MCVLERCGKYYAFKSLVFIWWEFFYFGLVEIFVDFDDLFIFGVIFENKFFFGTFECYFSNYRYNVFRYVIVFRGIVMRLRIFFNDFKLDIRVILNRLCMSLRY